MKEKKECPTCHYLVGNAAKQNLKKDERVAIIERSNIVIAEQQICYRKYWVRDNNVNKTVYMKKNCPLYCRYVEGISAEAMLVIQAEKKNKGWLDMVLKIVAIATSAIAIIEFLIIMKVIPILS